MTSVNLVCLISLLAIHVNGKHIVRREINNDIEEYAIGPTVRPDEAYKFRYQVAFREKCGQNCGGTILSDRHILTAAHCVFASEPGPMTIKVGVTYVEDPINGQIVDVFAVTTHRNYLRSNLQNDIALLTLQKPLNLTGLTVAKLPEFNEDFEGEKIEASGWGHTVNLTYAYFTVKHNENCDHPSRLCAEPYPDMNTYQGDSGGPVILRRGNDVVLVGIVSGKSGTQVKFSKVSYLRPWIDAAMHGGNQMAQFANGLQNQLPVNECKR